MVVDGVRVGWGNEEWQEMNNWVAYGNYCPLRVKVTTKSFYEEMYVQYLCMARSVAFNSISRGTE
jgi:hypothetical protein